MLIIERWLPGRLRHRRFYSLAELNAAISELLRANTQAVAHVGSEFSGPGFDVLVRGAADAQFVCLGEQHNSRQIPAFAAALFKQLRAKAGFKHVALEQDPFICELASSREAAGSLDAVAALARRYPNAFTFLTDQELELIAAVGAKKYFPAS